MSRGSRTMLSPFAIHSTRMAIAASPAPRKAAFCRKQQQDDDVAPEHDARVRNPRGHHVLVGAHDVQDVGREGHAGDAEHDCQRQSQKDGLRGCTRRPVPVASTDPARHHGRHPDAQPHRERVDQRQDRLGQRHPPPWPRPRAWRRSRCRRPRRATPSPSPAPSARARRMTARLIGPRVTPGRPRCRARRAPGRPDQVDVGPQVLKLAGRFSRACSIVARS